MAIYPESVITTDSKGRKEARMLIERGTYTRYTYVDPDTGNMVKEGKETVFISNTKGIKEKLFIIPIAGGKSFLFRKKEHNTADKVWNPALKKAENIFE